jgi:hypothetical protein
MAALALSSAYMWLMFCTVLCCIFLQKSCENFIGGRGDQKNEMSSPGCNAYGYSMDSSGQMLFRGVKFAFAPVVTHGPVLMSTRHDW